MDATSSELRDLPALARERVTVGPPPDWITACPYNPDFQPTLRGATTFLLLENQVHAERHETFIQVALRLETMQAVQDQSQWRIEIDPQTQWVVLHSIKVRKGARESEHASVERMQFLRRETGLGGLVIDGTVTLLVLLENVSPGDIIEWSYTITNRPRLLPESVSSLFALPQGVFIGKCHFSVRHAAARPLRWKSSSPELSLNTENSSGEVHSFWLRDNFSSPEPEEATPQWKTDFPWIQISDCPDWQTVASAVDIAWNHDTETAGLAELAEQITAATADPLARIDKAIDLVQEEFRYLSVNVALGGQIPTPTETVIRRRYGDCKDKALLLVQLLRALGVTACPVLVHGTWCGSVAQFLPSAGVFNHAIVEFEYENERRWVDATAKAQGRGALKRAVANFGCGLPVDSATTELATVPAASLPAGSCELKESYLLDTAGNSSYLAVMLTAKGVLADMWRLEFQNEGLQGVARKQLQFAANRFGKATRVGELEYRDDREQNEFVFAQVFEIEGFLRQENKDTCVFFLNSDVTAGALHRPSPAARRNPFALPFPYQYTHIIEIDSPGLSVPALQPRQVSSRYFAFSRQCKSLPKFLKLTFSLATLVDAVPPEKVQEHRNKVEEVWRESSWTLRLPTGYRKLRKRSDFGALPRPRIAAPMAQPPSTPAVGPSTPAVQPVQPVTPNIPEPAVAANVATVQHATFAEPVVLRDPEESSPRRRSRSGWHTRNRRRDQKCALSLGMLGVAVFLFLVIVVLSHFHAYILVGFIALAEIPSLITALGLAVVGLRECARHPDRYPRGKNMAITTLAVGGVFALTIVVPGAVRGIGGMIAGAKAREQMARNGGQVLKFEPLNFVFRPLHPPWIQTDSRRFGRDPVLAFVGPGPLYFTICVNPLEPGYADPLHRVVTLCKANQQRQALSLQLITEHDESHNGIAGWRTESRGNFQGQDFYMVHWIIATNGFGYQLQAWGPSAAADVIKKEADGAFGNFELTGAQTNPSE